MPTESNTSSNFGQKGVGRVVKGIKAHAHGETRIMIAREIPRERMSRVIRTVRRKKK